MQIPTNTTTNYRFWASSTAGNSTIGATDTVHFDCVLPGTTNDIRHGLASVRLAAL